MRARLLALLIVLLAALALFVALHDFGGQSARVVGPADDALSPAIEASPAHALQGAELHDAAADSANAAPSEARTPLASQTVDDRAPTQKGRIHGHIVAERKHGQPFEPRELELTAESLDPRPLRTDSKPFQWSFSPTRLDAHGDYEFGQLEMGHWRLRCTLPLHESAIVEVQLAPATPDLTVDLTLVGHRLVRITLLDSRGFSWAARRPDELPGWWTALRPLVTSSCGTPNPGAVSLPQKARSTDKDKDGSWFEIELTSSDPLCAHVYMGDVEIGEQAVPPGAENIALTLDLVRLRRALGTVTVHVVDESGFAITRGKVALRPRLGQERTETLDTSGAAVLADCTAGHATIEVRASGYAVAHDEIEIKGGDPMPALTIKLERTVKIRGQLRDIAGKPLKGQISMAPIDDWNRAAAHTESAAYSGSDGAFEFSDLKPRLYLLTQRDLLNRDGPDVPFMVGQDIDDIPGWPVPARVRSGEIAGFTVVDARGGDVNGVVVAEVAHRK